MAGVLVVAQMLFYSRLLLPAYVVLGRDSILGVASPVEGRPRT